MTPTSYVAACPLCRFGPHPQEHKSARVRGFLVLPSRGGYRPSASNTPRYRMGFYPPIWGAVAQPNLYGRYERGLMRRKFIVRRASDPPVTFRRVQMIRCTGE